jgi:hypothetical protein
VVLLDDKTDITNNLLQGDSTRIVAILDVHDQNVPADVMA